MKKGLIILLFLGVIAAIWRLYPRKEIEFSADVKPIINKNCITCHGGVRRKAGFSLLFRQEALEPTESGKPAIIPGNADGSEMIRRITLDDPEERMPYKHEPLKSEEISILRQWIQEGAKWGDHWAYVPVKPTTVPSGSPSVDGAPWAKSEIDFFIADKWNDHKLTPSPKADKATLLRRVSLDLTGLPPDPELAKQFLSDKTPRAFENLVDALLSSPHYGEHLTAMWQDLARYADTKGYERDYTRNIWRYRDWLIKAFNVDKPYNQFITEQLAGDLVPNPTDDQLIATAFHRNTMTNDEGGTDNEEFRTAAVLDRVNTTWEALMGTTFACTQCHSHPYDPFHHDEYYKFVAFFNTSSDEDTDGDYPVFRSLDKKDSARLTQLSEWVTKVSSSKKADEIRTFIKTWQPSINSLTADQFTNSELADSKWLILRNHGVGRLQNVDLSGKQVLIYRYASWFNGGTCTIHLDRIDGPILTQVRHVNSKGAWVFDRSTFNGVEGVHDLYFRYENPTLTKAEDNGIMFDWLYFMEEFPGKDKPGYDDAWTAFWQLATAETQTTPIMIENPTYRKRKSYVFERGNWLLKGKEVEPATPNSLVPFPTGAPINRLGLAQWMTSPDHPLTTRTIVNRIWEQLFGIGLAETLEDLGTQGIPPTHQELLDYLAGTFITKDHWSLKSLLKRIVMSETYQQDSRLREGEWEKDPYNKYYARGSRVRLSAEQVRDQALAVSGLLSSKMYGPSVMPYQPKGIWNSPYNELSWKMSKGEDSYRRGIYTFWKRTNAYPSMLLFDGVSREVCSARRIRTNTPLQALTTLNDSVYVVAARSFAHRIRNQTNGDIRSQITKGYELALGKPITEDKLSILMQLYDRTATHFQSTSQGGKKKNDPLELVATAILNLDEFITKN